MVLISNDFSINWALLKEASSYILPDSCNSCPRWLALSTQGSDLPQSMSSGGFTRFLLFPLMKMVCPIAFLQLAQDRRILEAACFHRLKKDAFTIISFHKEGDWEVSKCVLLKRKYQNLAWEVQVGVWDPRNLTSWMHELQG